MPDARCNAAMPYMLEEYRNVSSDRRYVCSGLTSSACLAAMVEGHVGGLPVGITGLLSQGLRVEVVLNDLALIGCLRGKQVPWNLLAMDHLRALLLHSSCIAAGGSRPSASSRCHGNTCDGARGRSRAKEH